MEDISQDERVHWVGCACPLLMSLPTGEDLCTRSAKTFAGQAERVPGYEIGIILVKNRATLFSFMCLNMELGDFWDFHEVS